MIACVGMITVGHRSVCVSSCFESFARHSHDDGLCNRESVFEQGVVGVEASRWG